VGGGKGGRYVGLSTLQQPSCVECIEISEPKPPSTRCNCPGLYRDCSVFYVTKKEGGGDIVVYFDVLLTVHLSIILAIDQLGAKILVL